jgi:rhodanese-related sulfurtransferase
MRPLNATCVPLFALMICSVVPGCSEEASDPVVADNQGGVGTSITAKELSDRLESGNAPLVLDVRTVKEFNAGHIPGAINIPHNQLESRVDELGVPRETEIVVHCQAGGRAKAAEEILDEAGYSNVRDLEGHLGGWRSNRYPLEN